MKALKMIQPILLVVAAIMFLIGILTALNVIQSGALILTTGGFQRMADTCIFFSIALGVLLIVNRKAYVVRRKAET